METVLTFIHYGVCILLIGLVMLQSGKGADIGAAFGGGSSQTLFGGRGPATFINKATSTLAIVFFLTSISLAHFSRNQEVKSVVTDNPEAVMPAAPAEAAPEGALPSEKPAESTPDANKVKK